MSKIIVAIDFSESAINAFIHALDIAHTIHTDMLLVWVSKDPKLADKYVPCPTDPTKDVEQAFKDLIAEHQPKLPGNTISYKIRKGKVYTEIAAEAKQQKALMVVCGTHGASGFEKFWIGSNANRMISACACPVLTIRAGLKVSRPLKKIVMSIDSTQETRQKASFTAMLAKVFDAEIFIIKLYTTKQKSIRQNVDLYASQVERFLTHEGIRFNTVSEDSVNIATSIMNYGKKIDANLIAMMTEQENTASTLWLGPFAMQIVNQSPIPVLSIHPKDVYTAAGF
jgi:nucleotide-binding universal stress UspA family protein